MAVAVATALVQVSRGCLDGYMKQYSPSFQRPCPPAAPAGRFPATPGLTAGARSSLPTLRPAVAAAGAALFVAAAAPFRRHARAAAATALAAKKKKRVDPEVLAKRARALKIREEAMKKAAMLRAQQSGDERAFPEAPPPARPPAKAAPVRASARSDARALRVSSRSPPQRPPPRSPPRSPAPRLAPRSPPRAARPPAPPGPPPRAASAPPSRRGTTSRTVKVCTVTNSASTPAATDDQFPTPEQLRCMKVVELKDVLRGAGLKVSGLKAELLERLLEHIGAA
mmetsp:Transcript_82962/g.231456  ORF Transcript_82962/g.231456 Transcript_82962/m.231456 type:complete len:283 (-) Transcript_82962:84-932(-)